MDTIVINVTPPPEIVIEVNEGGIAADRANASAAAAAASALEAEGFADDAEGFKDTAETAATNATDAYNLIAPHLTAINDVDANAANINAAVANEANINAAVANETNINAAVANETNINIVAANDTDISTVADNIADVNTVADNIADVQFVADASLEEVSTSGTAAVEEITATDILFGDAVNYSKFDADGTLRMYGTATVFDDSMVPATVFRTGGTALTFTELTNGLYAHRFDVTDVIHFMVQFPHRMKIDSTIFPHIHIINQAAIVGAANVTFTLRYTWANINASFPAVTPDANVILDLADADALTHRVKSFAAIVPVAGQGGFSSILVGSLERVNSGYTANNIFLGGFDIHYEVDSLGTKGEYVK